VAENNGDASLSRPRLVVVAALGTSQTLAWASSNYQMISAVSRARPLMCKAIAAVPGKWGVQLSLISTLDIPFCLAVAHQVNLSSHPPSAYMSEITPQRKARLTRS